MAATLTVRDETPAGSVSEPWSLEFLDESITVRELIRERVYQEVQDYNLKNNSALPYRGLVQPEGLEKSLNPHGTGAKVRTIDWKKQYDKALEAFETNRILILIDDRQAESLDESFTIGPETAVTFLRLTLLVGG
jgi:hypothetical protein